MCYPLRTRGEDILLLAKHFWTRAVAQTGGHAASSSDTLSALIRHDWPGNVRELENVMSALAVRAPRRGWARASLLPAELTAAGGRPGLAAKELGISRQGLAKLMTRLELKRD